MDFGNLISIGATVSTILMFLTHLKTPIQIKRNINSIYNIPFLPHVMTFFNCALWEKYGILKGDPGMIIANFTGIIINTHVIFVYYKNSRDLRNKVEKSFSIMIITLICILSYVKLNRGLKSYTILGFISSISTIVMFGFPISTLKKVITTKNNSSLSIKPIIILLISSALWTLYGYVIKDNFVCIPNGLGCLLAVVQLLIYKLYSKREYSLPQNTIQMTPFHMKN
ncbi:hypothetical protein H8356DRAFT_1433846 [Neocallimastix lanati (nom. inval.)]|uniref:Sugar transporter SWEET1 n=1 Tax=Neocallimastix californiae TaxID=1754190 RepID=A0A1Y2EG93_9FUNG|nr:hypothetical protein H8356DRAFT_1433846 [Neocallimastix sp. JGI-2020a]ORY70592.1 hypothetical protein LY90DRAFT_207465 [Neocallimastix californiae]|eukprot:ORY70592.1 hypothetical protein LY90DRAFT_207465 [Neocallimastix californiae]